MPDPENRFARPQLGYNDSPQGGGPQLTMPSSMSPEELKQLIMQAMLAGQRIDPNGLQGPDAQSQYAAAQKFLEAAQAQLGSNPHLASKLADKANVMFGALYKPNPTDTGLVGLLKPLLGHQRP